VAVQPVSTGGTHDDIEGVVSLHHDFVLRVCRLRLPTEHDAQDAAQETMLRYLQADRSRIHAPTAWFAEVAARVCATWHRQRYRRPEVLVEHVDDLAHDHHVEHGSEHHLVDASIIAADRIWLDAVASRIGPRDYRLLYMLYVQRLTSEQVGALLGLTAGHVRVLSLRARRAAAITLADLKTDLSLE
jgi:RNA polymerase sigma factor (sigma-70 family)